MKAFIGMCCYEIYLTICDQFVTYVLVLFILFIFGDQYIAKKTSQDLNPTRAHIYIVFCFAPYIPTYLKVKGAHTLTTPDPRACHFRIKHLMCLEPMNLVEVFALIHIKVDFFFFWQTLNSFWPKVTFTTKSQSSTSAKPKLFENSFRVHDDDIHQSKCPCE